MSGKCSLRGYGLYSAYVTTLLTIVMILSLCRCVIMLGFVASHTLRLDEAIEQNFSLSDSNWLPSKHPLTAHPPLTLSDFADQFGLQPAE